MPSDPGTISGARIHPGYYAQPMPPAQAERVSVLIADDQRLVRTGFPVILASEPGIEVVGEAANGAEAVDLAAPPAGRRPDGHPDAGPGRLRGDPQDSAPGPARVLMLTTFDTDEYVYEALRAGASGFLLKDAPADQLVAAVRCVAAGDALIDPASPGG